MCRLVISRAPRPPPGPLPLPPQTEARMALRPLAGRSKPLVSAVRAKRLLLLPLG